ncbi:Hsp33 family molecular chaperone HslO [Lysinibacillus sp. OL1_EC]|uniref:Hsp33 family molecular chaperone HslO n=1 Tax=unclassified Lysinibacillus TaxID=2636778 RepID=UPI0010396F5E|nr:MULTISPECIES: Hsp33 family molecular chaperone HslO [unclassified Lysinibacillus]MCM0624491.1 Hsp33 family molecular chaperone HslO [Lysinibacillus sp. OL1_EC]TBV88238.1 Hsp33 family molecular chaperone HslO [Lysinibacillus sp. OL1]
MKDYLVKATAYNNQVRAYVAITTDTIKEARRRHDMQAIASIVLGRSMSAGVILGAMLKGEEKLTIKINGGGTIGTILVDANAKGEVRGNVANPNVHSEKNEQLDIKSAVGTNGILSVTKDIGLNHPFIGQVPMTSGEIGEDFASYLLHSEQVPSSVGVGVLLNQDLTIEAAGGFIIQLMPNTEEETIQKIEERLKKISSISSMIGQGVTPENILQQLLGEENITVLDSIPVQFRCDCSRDRISNGILSLGSVEIQDMINTDGQAEAQCHFCNESYYYTKEDLESLLKEISI